MPIYEYKCDTCGHIVELVQPIGAPPPYCEVCDKKLPPETTQMTKQISRTSFILKGGGWAADGYGG